jgi:GTPase
MNDEEKNLVLDILYLSAEGKLIPEPDKSGNVEYKLRLDKKDVEKRDNMVSQMLWRMNEGRNMFGRYEAHYILGIKDDGNFSNMSEKELNLTIHIFRSIAKKANAKITSEKTYVFPGNKMITHIIVRKDYQERVVPEANVLIMGPYDAGKSSLMGRLTYGQNDDGNGFSRKLVLRHVHEKTSGSTSCPKYDSIGFLGANIMNYSIGMDFNMENIYTSSDRIINLIDIPGDMKYIKTILYSVSSIRPDHIIVCIPFKKVENTENLMDVNDVIEMYKDEYIFIVSLCIAYNVQPVFVFTKCDIVKNELINHDTYSEKIINKFNNLIESLNSESLKYFNDCMCVQVSNITDVGYNELISILSRLKMNMNSGTSVVMKDKLFTVIDSFTIPDTGHIIHGILRYGIINVDDEVDVLCHGLKFKKKVKTIHRKTLDVDTLSTCGESGSITFYGSIDKRIDKTAVILGPSWDKHILSKAKVKTLFATNKLKSQQYMLFVDNNIVTVILSQNEDSDVFELVCVNNSNFMLDTSIGLLKDEQQNYYFINFV